jgi:serine/threonine-protein kinase
MAPEQAAADPATDFRADIYAFGAVGYEMLAGHSPFAGRSPQAMLAAHATQAPPPITALRPATPPRLADLVMRCLEKRPGDRPQSAAELLRALDALGTPAEGSPAAAPLPGRAERSKRGTLIAAGIATVCLLAGAAWWWRAASGTPATGPIRAIAVLPLENTTRDTTIDYLEDGVTDHVRDALNAVPGLTVKARSSSQQARGRTPHAIGTALGVGAVLQGTVSRSGTGLHVTTELVRTADDNALWSRTFDGQPSELAGIQDTIAAEVARALDLRLGGGAGGAGALARRGTADRGAYDSFLRGRAAYDRLQFPRAVFFFRDALARDPEFARAEGYLAMSYANEPVLDVGPIDSVNDLARAAAARALAIDSAVVEAYIAESFVLLSEMRFGDALAPLGRAMEIDSTNATLLTAYGVALVQAGRLDEGRRLARQAVERDPLSAQAVGVYSYILGVAGESKEAIAQMRTALELDPRNVLEYRVLGYEFAFARMPDSAVAAFEAGMRLDSVAFSGRSSLLFGYAVAGRWSDVDRQRARLEREPWEPNYSRMVAELVEGDTVAAMTSLEHGIAARDQYLGIISIPCDPLFDPLKANRRFAALMERIGAHACPTTLAWPVGRRPPAPRKGRP